MRSAVRVLAGVLSLLLLAVASDQVLTRGYIYSSIGSLFSWSGSSQSWSGSVQAATCADFYVYIKNDGTTCASGSATLLDSYALAHAVNSTTHTPIVLNGTFATGSFTSWASANTGSCNGTLFNGQYVGGTGLAGANSGTCVSPVAVVTLTQTFTAGTSPTAQTYSFQYAGSQSTSGTAAGGCTLGTGSASLILVINGTTVATVASPTLDGNWHTVSGTMTAMATGSNTFSLNATLAGASGTNLKHNPAIGYYCLTAPTSAQPIQITNVVLSAVW